MCEVGASTKPPRCIRKSDPKPLEEPYVGGDKQIHVDFQGAAESGVTPYSLAPWEEGRWWGSMGQALPPASSHLHLHALPTAPMEQWPPPGKLTSIAQNTQVCSQKWGLLHCLWGAAQLEAGSSPWPWDGQQQGSDPGSPASWSLGLLKQEKERRASGESFLIFPPLPWLPCKLVFFSN